jgi:hypothetical protein
MWAFLPKRKRKKMSEDTNMETVDVSTDKDTSELDARASNIVIASFEREATEARGSADPDLIQDIQDRYHDARMERAKRQMERERNE